MSHRNAPLTPAGRLRLIERCQSRPVAHVAAEAGVSRQCLSKWKNRYDALGELGLLDRSSAPWTSPTQLAPQVVERIEQLWRTKKWSARRITIELNIELAAEGMSVSVATVGRWLVRLGLNRRRDLDPDGHNNRASKPGQITARYPGHMIHIDVKVDVKKIGRIPDGGGWRVHGRGSDQHHTTERAKTKAKTKGAKAGYVYLHTAVDGFSRLAYTEHLHDETGPTAAGFWHRARAFFAAHGITRITRVVTDNGSCYRSTVFARALNSATATGIPRHQRSRPFTPKHNAKVERYHRILAEELLYARTWTSEAQRATAIQVWNIHYNYHRPHTAAGDKPPATRLRARVTNVMIGNN